MSALNDSIRVSEDIASYEKDKASGLEQSGRKHDQSKRISELARINS